jgi:hypothetical protein
MMRVGGGKLAQAVGVGRTLTDESARAGWRRVNESSTPRNGGHY